LSAFSGYVCSVCGRRYAPEQATYTCSDDGGNLDVVLDWSQVLPAWDPGKIAASREGSIWRYLPLMPVDDPGLDGTPLRAVGWTPVYDAPSLASGLGVGKLWLKDDGRNPTASFKDRASAVVVARAREIGAQVVITASTGNAGAALAGMAAAAGVPAVILAPKTAPPAKVAQLLIFGARVILVDGTYDDAFDLSLAAAEEFGWYCRNTGYNPFTAEGKKTAAFEIAEQLSGLEAQDQWHVPDAVLVSVGDGNIISGLHKGFKDLRELGWTERVPRLFGIQSTGSAAITNAYRAGSEKIEPVRADTLADSISVDLPRDGLRALRAATETGGAYLAVPDDSILAAIAELGARAGVFAEPAGAAPYAGLKAACDAGLLGGQDEALVLVTGSGLKDVKAARQAAGQPGVIEPTLEALRVALEKGSQERGYG
jgi:threonine synthase